MSFLETAKGKIGAELYLRLENEAEKEVASAIQMPLRDKWGQEQYHWPKFLLADFFSERQCFEELGLKISPLDVIDILFKCKMLFAVQSQDEYMKRIGGGMQNNGLWRDKSGGTLDAIIRKAVTAGTKTQESLGRKHPMVVSSCLLGIADYPRCGLMSGRIPGLSRFFWRTKRFLNI